jgi:hypothetical protein
LPCTVSAAIEQIPPILRGPTPVLPPVPLIPVPSTLVRFLRRNVFYSSVN